MAVPSLYNTCSAISDCGKYGAQVSCSLKLSQGATGCVEIQIYNKSLQRADLSQFSVVQVLITDVGNNVVAIFSNPELIGSFVDAPLEIHADGTVKGCFTAEMSSNAMTGRLVAEIKMVSIAATGQISDTVIIKCIEVGVVSASSFSLGYTNDGINFSGGGGNSGPSGGTGTSGTSGTSGVGSQGPIGPQGPTGPGITSGTSGTEGTSGTSGTSGISGVNGTDGTSGVDGTSGTSGTSGAQGVPGDPGIPISYIGFSTDTVDLSAINVSDTVEITVESGLGYTIGQHLVASFDLSNSFLADVISYDISNGTLTLSVISITGSGSHSTWQVNLSGVAGGTGTSGTSGAAGSSGTSGLAGTSGTSGTRGTSGTSGTSGNGTSGSSGTAGSSGSTGTSGASGTSGTSGTRGTSGTSGTSGNGTSGTSGVGSSGTSGTSGIAGTSGTSGTTPTGTQNYAQVLGSQVNGVNTTGVTLVSGTIVTTGKPVQIEVTGDANPTGTGAQWVRIQLFRDGSSIGSQIQAEQSAPNLNVPYCLNVIDTPSAGSHTYTLRTTGIAGTFQFGEVSGPLLTMVELAGSGSSGTSGSAGTAGTSGTGVSASYARGSRATAQTTGLTANGLVVFTQVDNSTGSDISLNTSTGQITLAANRTYRLMAQVPTITNSGSNSRVSFCWYNETTSSWVGSISGIYSPNDGASYASSMGMSETLITTSGTTVVSYRILNNGLLTGIGGSSDFSATGQFPWFDIQVISGMAPLMNGTSGTSGGVGTQGPAGTSGTSGTSGVLTGSIPAWTSAGAITIGATTTAPTKPTTRVQDNISYRQIGAKQWEVIMSYVVTSATGAVNGTGDYLFTLPNSLSFDTTLPSQQIYTSGVATSSWNNITYVIPSGSGVINNGTVGGQVYPLVYNSTTFRIVTTTYGNAVQCWGAGYYGAACPGMQLTFRFTST